jgi:peptidoglycan L-alanyl-D-glutamate endopeptidase CwlK
MSRALNDLDPRFRPLAIEFIARCVEAGIAILIVDTLRTPAEHAVNVSTGRSWVARSKHLDGLAIDICPYAQWSLNGPDKLQWDGDDPVWERLGAIGESLGLRWGGRWQQRDLGHFEYALPPSGQQEVVA